MKSGSDFPAFAQTFDDVLLLPGYSEVLPSSVAIGTRLCGHIKLAIPIMSAAMDTVTETPMAIGMAQHGGIGVLHKNMSIADQCRSVRQVKRYENGMVMNPITLHPDSTLAQARRIMEEKSISGFPVVEQAGSGSGRLVGVLTNRDIRFAEDESVKIKELMTRERLVTVKPGATRAEIRRLCQKYRIERVVVVDEAFHCIGLITVRDMENERRFPFASKDAHGCLRVAAACGVGDGEKKRIKNLIEAGADVIVLDTAHGHSRAVIEQLVWIKDAFASQHVVAGNVATSEGAQALCDAGADAIKVGIGPGSICTTRIVTGVGVPQLSAIRAAARVAVKKNIPVIADGGLRYSGDMAKALAAGASVAMVGSLLAGTDEAPGAVFYFEGRAYKSYRGMGSVPAMARGSADRYFQEGFDDHGKFVPEGVEGRVPYKGPVGNVLHQLVGGVRASMGYVGAENIAAFWRKAQFTAVSVAGQRESHAHDVTITRESPNYPK